MRFLRFKRWLNELLSASNHTSTRCSSRRFDDTLVLDAAHAYGGFMGTPDRVV